ncbi:contact-dependent growth inhibition system immunity protein [Advenella mimigardefordensis]|uniref:CdiI immunity protein domain-containing protein n=1 Tax=Advenella mimigardefordensis (strain DSM 17166 / LMG 22922 / DPN7) TaxID=1247726 RepID=W0PEP9_ADVMD|nr:contact-dependent growth inhibition system immunity protein [Advenella mimigardefordensis]AHG65449.1 hypothetical protein MIM_c33880 [Advenella mimigardefordensis DPN7]
MNHYPHIRNLLDAYLNMDVDTIAGTDEPDEIIQYYVLDTSKPVLEELVDELDHFEESNGQNLDDMFEKEFSPEVDIADIREFFNDLRTAIQKYLSQS